MECCYEIYLKADAAIKRANELLGDTAEQLGRSTSRLWAQGEGLGATNGYGEIQRNIRPPTQSPEVVTNGEI